MTTYTVAYWQSNQSTLDSGPAFTITDTAANISGAFDSLDLDAHITQLIISDNAAVTVSINQLFVSDTHAISILHNANSSAYTLVVSDTGANITPRLNGLQSDTHVTQIVVTSGVVDATVSQLATDPTALANLKTSLNGPQASITVSDTSAHLHSGWANVAADSQVSSIAISDNTPLSLTATQASQTSAVEKLVYGNATTSDIVLVKDTSAHIEADLTQLNTVVSFISTVTVSDNTFETLSAGLVTSDLAILEKVVFSSGPATFSVSDSSVNVSANLDALESLSGSISTIAVTDNSPITVSIAQLSNDSDALALITYNSNPISVAVSDTASNISGNIATLEAAIEAASPPITSISVSDSNPINVSVTQLTSDSAVFSALTGIYTLNVTDTASNISGDLDNLQTLAHSGNISAINVTDSGAIAVTVAQITSDAAAIAELVNNDTNPYTLAVTDSVADIQAAFTSLSTNTHIASVTFTDGTPVLTITATQFISGTTVLGEITNGSFTIDVTGATAAQAATIATDFAGLPNEGSATLSIAVSDTAAHISSHLVALGANTYVATIAIDDSNPLSLTEAQYTDAAHDAGLDKMTGTYAVDVTGVTVAQVPTVDGISGLGGTPTVSIAVSDTASNVGDALSTLGSDAKVTSIAVSDSNPITLTEAQFTLPGDGAGLAKMTGSYTVDVTGATVAQVSGVEAVTLGGTPTLSIAVSDAGGSFTNTALQTLGTDNDVTSIAVTSGVVTLNVTPFTNAADDAGLAKFVGAYTVQVLGVSVAQVATVEGISLPGTPTLQIWVSDSGTNFTDSAMKTLGADSKVVSIYVSDSNPITLTEAQFTGTPEGVGLAKMAGFYTVDVTGVTVGQVSTVEAVFLPGSATLSIAVSDTASTIAGALSTLGSDSNVTSIAVNDSNPISLAEATFVADSAGLGKMTGTYTVDVTGVSVAQIPAVEGVTLGGAATLSIAVSDAASAVEVALGTLGSDTNVTSIALSPAGTIALTEANYTSASYDAGLAKMTGSYIVDVQGVTVAQVAAVEAVTGLGGTPTVGMDVRDTGAAVSAALVSLGSDSKVADIALTSGVIALTEAQYTNSGDQAGLAKLTGAYTVDVSGVTAAQVPTVEGVSLPGTPTLSIAVSDTGSAISGYLGDLGGDPRVTSIAVNDSNPITLTEGTFVSDGAGLAKMTGAYTVDVSGVTVGEVGTVEGVALGGTPTLSIAVVDSGLNITDAALQSLSSDSKVTSITVNDSNPIALTEAQFTGAPEDAGLAKMIGSYTVDVSGVSVAQLAAVEGVTLPGTPTLSIAITDSGANLSGAEMATLGSDTDVTSIAVSSGTLTLTETQFAADSAGLAKLTGAYAIKVTGATVPQVSTVEGTSLPGTPTLTIAVADNGANITDSALQTLGADSKVTSIASTGGSIGLTETQFTGAPEIAGLAKMTGSYNISVGGVTVAEISTVEGESLGGTPTLSINVQDVGSNLTSSALSTLGADTKVQHISVSSGSIALTESQFTNSGVDAGLAKMNGSYTVAVSGVSAAQVATVEAVPLNGSPTLQITVSDTGGHLTAAELTTLGSDPDVTAITTSSPITLTETQFTTAGVDAGLAKMTGAYTVDVTGVLVSQVSTVEGQTGLGGTPTLSIAVSDTGANITAAKLISLGADGKVTSIAVTSGPLSLTESQFTASGEHAGLLKMTGPYTVDVSGVGVAFVSTVEAVTLGGTPTLSIAVTDIGSRLTSAELVTLGADHKVTSITATSGALSISQAQFTAAADHAGLLKMIGAYTVDVTFVTVARVAAVEAVTLGGTPTLSIAVADTSANLTPSVLSTLGADSHVTTIAVSSGTIVMFEPQFTNGGTDAGLAKMTGAYTITAIGVTVAQVPTVEGVTLGGTPTFQIQVADIGSNLTAAVLSAFGSNTKIGLIEASSGPITLTEAQFTNAGVDAGLAKMGAGYTVDVTGVSVAQVTPVETQTGLGGSPTLSIAVSDTGANITSAALSTLGADSIIASIADTSGPITLTEAQFTATADDAGLAKMTGAYTVDVTGVTAAQVVTVENVTGLGGAPTLSIAVSDVGSNITDAALQSLGADGKVTSIAVSSGTISLTEAQVTGTLEDAGLAKMTGTFGIAVSGVSVAQVATVESVSISGTPNLSIAVSDVGANITDAALQSLGSDGKVTSISVSDSNPITLTESQFTGAPEHAGLAKMLGSYTVDVTGVTVAQVATVEGVTGLGGTPTLSIAVSDTGAHLFNNPLIALGSDSDVTSIAVTSGAIILGANQFLAADDEAGLAKLTGSYTIDVNNATVAQVATVEAVSLPGTPTLSITVSDTGAHITSAALASFGSDGDVASIAVAGGAISLTEAQFTAAADDAGLAKMIGAYTVDVTGVSAAQVPTVEAVTGLGGTPTLSIAVSDSGANLTSTVLTSLGSDPDVTSIAATSAISLTESQFVDSGVDAGLTKMTGAYTVDVTGVTVAQVGAVEGVTGLGGSPTLSIAVSDTGAHITDAALQTLGADSNVTSIAVFVGPIELTEAQFTGTPEAAGLAKMTGAYQVEVSGVTVAEVPTVEGVTLGGTPSLGIGISDIGSNLTSAALVSLGSDSKVVLIQDTSGAISLTESQFTNASDDAGLAKMTGAYTVDISGVSVAQLSTVEGQTGLGGSPTLSIGVVDTGAHITDAELQSLGADGDVATIAVSSGTISLTEAQITGTPEEAGLAKMTGTFGIAVSGVSVAQVATVESVSISGTPILSIAVSDTGADLTDAALASLGPDGRVTSITDTSGAISLTETQFTGSNEQEALAKMTGSYTVDVSGVTVAEIATVEGLTLGGTPTLSIAVRDTGGDITSAALVSMGADSKVASIAVTSGPITLNESQFIAPGDVNGLEKIVGAFTVDVTGVVASQAATVKTDFTNLTNSANGTLSIAVSDIAQHVANNAPALNTNTDVTSVTVTDTAAHVALYLDILNGVQALTDITLTDTNPVLTLTESQFVGGALALATISNNNVTMDVTGATASQAGTVESDFAGLANNANFTTFAIAVADTAANVANNASSLNSDANVNAIHVTDNQADFDTYIDTLDTVTALTAITFTNTTPVLSLTAIGVEDAAAALAVVTNSAFTVDATGATAAQAAAIASEISGLSDASHITLATAVSDLAATISSDLNALENDHVSALTISDSNPLNITYAQFNADSTVLGKLTGTDTVNVTGVTGQAYGSFTDTYIGGHVAETIENNTNGSTSVFGYANSLTFTASGPSAHVESFNTTGTHFDTFMFAGSFGNDSITGFNLNNDTINFSSAEFANVAAVELHTTQVNGNAVVTLDSGDTITMVGISMASFDAHSTDWTFS
jgi:hypothetical protein